MMNGLGSYVSSPYISSPGVSSSRVSSPCISPYFSRKWAVDFIMALPLFIAALPLILLAWILVRLTSHGPGFYKQVRLGLNGKPFMLYKIRTMRVNAEMATGAIWAARNDRRTTWIGKILRETNIDELPQLLNILRGEMSLVGPRPERPELISELEKRIDGYAYRLDVKPGLTGLAQLNQDSDIDLNDVRRKLVFDFDYLEHASFWFDMRLFVCSLLKAAHLCSPAVMKIFHLHREASQSHWAETLLPINYSPKDEERLSKIFAKRTTV